MKNDITTHPDFKKYYDKRTKRNYWLLGYFGGGPLNVFETMEVALQYANSNSVSLNSVKIDEVLYSRRYKGYKFMYSTETQKPEKDSTETDDIHSLLHN